MKSPYQKNVNFMLTVTIYLGVIIRLQRVARAEQALLDLILAHHRHRRARVENHAAVVALVRHLARVERVVPPAVVLIKDSLT